MKMKRAGMISALSALSMVLWVPGCTRKATQGEGKQGKAKVDAPLKSDMADPKAGMDPKAAKLPPGDKPLMKAPEGDQKNVVEGANRFALAMYAQLRSVKGNVFLSPWSINTAVGMTYAGAKGTTATQMAKVMRYSLAQPKLHPAVGAHASLERGHRHDPAQDGLQEGSRVFLAGAAALPHHLHDLARRGDRVRYLVDQPPRERVGDPLDVEGPDAVFHVLDHREKIIAKGRCGREGARDGQLW